MPPAIDPTNFGCRLLEETSYGVTPAAAMQIVNLSSMPLTAERTSERPNVITGDRRRFPKRTLSEAGALSLPAPMQYKNLLQAYEGLQMNDIASAISIPITGTVTIVGATGVITDSSSGFGALSDGDYVYVSGWTTNPSNNGWKGPITAASAGSITVPAAQVVDDSSAENPTFATRPLKDGILTKSYVGEWEALTFTNRFRYGNGFVCTQAQWSWETESFVQETFSFAGKMPLKAAATEGTGAPTAAPTSPYMTTVQDWGSLYIDGAASALILASWQLTVANGVNGIKGLGDIGPSDQSIGPADVDLSASIVFDDTAAMETLRGNAEDNDTVELHWDVFDPAGNRILFALPAAKVDLGNENVGEPGSIVDVAFTFSGHDSEKDDDSIYTSNAFGYQFGIFFLD
jgi:hypothetical protein